MKNPFKRNTLPIRNIIGKRFRINANLIKDDHIKFFMNYMGMADIRTMEQDEVDVFMKEAKAVGIFH
jgi:hypothetical protein